MKSFLFGLLFLGSFAVHAESDKIDLNFKSADIDEVTEYLSKKLGMTFIIDPALRGKLYFFNPEPVSATEAYNQFSSALALNNIAISVKGDKHILAYARNIQRGYIEVVKKLPPLEPERMVTYIFQFKNGDASEFNKQFRLMTSTQGEVYAGVQSNQLIITDWISNLYRVDKILKSYEESLERKKK